MYVNINGTQVFYKATGQGHSVVLLHGWGSSGDSFMQVHAFLERYFRVYSLDLPGFGRSAEPKTPWTLSDYVDVVTEFLRQFASDSPVLIGHSFGGRIIIKLASVNETKIRKIVLIDSAGIRPSRHASYYIRVYAYKFAKFLLNMPIIRLFSATVLERLRTHFGFSDYRSASSVMRQTMVNVVNEDLTPLLGRISSPTLLVWGENDTATPLADAKTMERLIPDAGLVVFKGAGHWSYIERLGEFLTVLSSYLKDEMVVSQ